MQMIVSDRHLCPIQTYYNTHNVADWTVQDNVCAL